MVNEPLQPLVESSVAIVIIIIIIIIIIIVFIQSKDKNTYPKLQ